MEKHNLIIPGLKRLTVMDICSKPGVRKINPQTVQVTAFCVERQFSVVILEPNRFFIMPRVRSTITLLS
jgi:hypothetical protein